MIDIVNDAGQCDNFKQLNSYQNLKIYIERKKLSVTMLLSCCAI